MLEGILDYSYDPLEYNCWTTSHAFLNIYVITRVWTICSLVIYKMVFVLIITYFHNMFRILAYDYLTQNILIKSIHKKTCNYYDKIF